MFEFLKDLGFTESKLFSLGHIGYFFFGVVIALFVLSVKFDALMQSVDKLRRFSFP